jgi:hypothetical protein
LFIKAAILVLGLLLGPIEVLARLLLHDLLRSQLLLLGYDLFNQVLHLVLAVLVGKGQGR